MKKLIINADDYGYTPGVTQGIIHTHLKGLVTSTTALSVSPYFLEAMEIARNYPTLAIGLHLTLTLRFAKPVLPAHLVPSLVDEKGEFLPLGTFAQHVDLKEIEMEWEAQILRFLECGRRPDHLDSHHNVHGKTPELLEIALKLARKYNLPLRNCERQDEQIGMVEKYYGNIPTPDQMKPEFYGKKATLETFIEILDDIKNSPKETFEMNCHPAFIDPDLVRDSSYVYERLDEVTILTSKAAKNALQERNILLANYEILQINSKKLNK
ncbi:MAG: carbohydrate deacetylase [Streptococcaceae bacterium]|nr:carbohydrate deacetylase [Streptococcaceae bacterium]